MARNVQVKKAFTVVEGRGTAPIKPCHQLARSYKRQVSSGSRSQSRAQAMVDRRKCSGFLGSLHRVDNKKPSLGRGHLRFKSQAASPITRMAFASAAAATTVLCRMNGYLSRWLSLSVSGLFVHSGARVFDGLACSQGAQGYRLGTTRGGGALLLGFEYHY